MASPWTEADYLAVATAIARGTLSVTYSGPPTRTVTYYSFTDMRSLLAMIRASLDADKATVKRYRRAQTDKNLG